LTDQENNGRSLMRMHRLYWLGWLVVAVLMAACAPSLGRAPINLPTPSAQATRPVAPATRTPAPTVTIMTVMATMTATVTPVSVQACHEEHGRLQVSYLDSPTLARRVAYSIYLPPCYDADEAHVYPVVYLLHGANADHTQWPDLNVAPDADTLIAQGSIAPLVVVMPDGDYEPGKDYAAFVLRDLMPHIEQTTRVARDRQGRAIGGISLGGSLALTIALEHPDLFSAVGGHSSAVDSTLAGRLTPTPMWSSLRVYLDVGQNDSLASGGKAFAAALEAHDLKPAFHLYPGEHDRTYWRAHTADYLAFYAADW
jgi:enterochelin esterase-like enzyme